MTFRHIRDYLFRQSEEQQQREIDKMVEDFKRKRKEDRENAKTERAHEIKHMIEMPFITVSGDMALI
jgi:hypothetical protein